MRDSYYAYYMVANRVRSALIIAQALADASLAGKKWLNVADLAERTKLSASYCEQLMKKLRRGQLVATLRGPGGGYALTKAPDQLTALHVVAAIDAGVLHDSRIERVYRELEHALERITLADMVRLQPSNTSVPPGVHDRHVSLS